MLCFMAFSHAQRKYTANKYFDELAYKKSAELYEKIYADGRGDTKIISKIADAYYFNTETEKAVVWYKKLVENLGNKVSKEHLYRYTRVLRSNGNYKASDSILNMHFKDKVALTGATNANYISEMLKNSGENSVKIHNVATNTQFSDFGGFMHNDSFYFASTMPKTKRKIYKWNEQPYLDLYTSEIKDSTVTIIDLVNKQKLPKKINTKYHEASMVLTKDGKTMYFTRVNYNRKRVRRDKKREVLLSIYKANLVAGKWKNIKKLPFTSNEYSTGHPTLSADEKTLYFISNMPGGFGETDIYKVAINDDGSFGNPKNLGKKVNTRGREMFPFISDKNILYFSSDGRKGLGALDIFEVFLGEKGKIEAVKNLKAPFNSNLDDFGFVVDANIKKGFFSSNRAGGKGDDDIYSFVMPKVQIAKIDSLDKKDAVEIAVHKEDTTVLGSDSTSKKAVKELVTFDKKHPLISGNQINVAPIYFDFDKHTIRKDAQPSLDKVVEVLKEHPEMVIKIESHTDSRGSRVYNKFLSDKRAKATRDYILKQGISSKQIESAIGYGEDKLLYPCKDGKCNNKLHQKNRRSYFYIVDNNAVVSQNSVKKSNNAVSDSFIRGNQIVTDPIYFDFDKDNIRKDAKIELEKVVEVMKSHPNMVIKIESHTDSRGAKVYNQKLSNKRAKSTKDYIISRGVSAKRIVSAIGYGEEKLLNHCDDKKRSACSNKEHQLNRRSYFYIVSNEENSLTSAEKD